MTIKVTATCEWCLLTVQTTLDVPLPLEWLQAEVVNVEMLAAEKRAGIFCTQEHADAFLSAAPLALEAAAKDYVAKFYAAMNEVRPGTKAAKAARA